MKMNITKWKKLLITNINQKGIKMKFIEFKDFGMGLCAVFKDDSYITEREIRLNKDNLELRITNLKEQSINCDLEEKILKGMNRLINQNKGETNE